MGDHSKLEGPENYLLHQEGIIFDADNPANSSLNIFPAKLFNGAEVDAKVQFEASKKRALPREQSQKIRSVSTSS